MKNAQLVALARFFPTFIGEGGPFCNIFWLLLHPARIKPPFEGLKRTNL